MRSFEAVGPTIPASKAIGVAIESSVLHKSWPVFWHIAPYKMVEFRLWVLKFSHFGARGCHQFLKLLITYTKQCSKSGFREIIGFWFWKKTLIVDTALPTQFSFLSWNPGPQVVMQCVEKSCTETATIIEIQRYCTKQIIKMLTQKTKWDIRSDLWRMHAHIVSIYDIANFEGAQ